MRAETLALLELHAINLRETAAFDFAVVDGIQIRFAPARDLLVNLRDPIEHHLAFAIIRIMVAPSGCSRSPSPYRHALPVTPRTWLSCAGEPRANGPSDVGAKVPLSDSGRKAGALPQFAYAAGNVVHDAKDARIVRLPFANNSAKGGVYALMRANCQGRMLAEIKRE